MTAFPASIFNPRTIANRPGVTYDANDTKTLFKEDVDAWNAEIIAIQNSLGVNLANLGLSGWFPLATIPILQSSDEPNYVLRFAADMTAIIGLGHRIKLTQHGSVKYFIVHAISAYSGGNTDITVYGGTDYAMEDTATYPVTVPYFSMQRFPFGFPADRSKWRVKVTYSSEAIQVTPTSNIIYNLGGANCQIVIPIGLWLTSFLAYLSCENGSTQDIQISAALSNANNTFSDSELLSFFRSYNSATASDKQFEFVATREKLLSLSAKTTMYLNAKTSAGGANCSYFAFRGATIPTIIQAVSAYF